MYLTSAGVYKNAGVGFKKLKKNKKLMNFGEA